MLNELFHPAVAAWFRSEFAAPTDVQQRAWPAIQQSRHALLAAPTGSGKTLAAFLASIDALIREGEKHGLPDETRVLYVSPLKALSNDIHKNLEQPLAGIGERLAEGAGLQIRAAVRTGDTPARARDAMRRRPPHILVTTPESLYILLTADSGREMLRTVRTVIVDELHAVAANKRGAHLMLSLERLSALCSAPPSRIGISATQKPISRMAEFLTGGRAEPCEIVDSGHVRERDLAIELPRSPLQPIMATEAWVEIYDRLAELVRDHRSTLIFVNTRRLAERIAKHLAERLDDGSVTAHHGSLAKEHRLDAEQRLKSGELKALVATASLELGIDIGDVDLACQLGSPRSIATFLQRIGRSGHAVNAVPKGRLFPLTRDDLVESAALLGAVQREELEEIRLQEPALDVLAQQIVAEVAAQEWSSDALYERVRLAWPYRALPRQRFDQVVTMLAEGYSTRRGRRGAHLHHDAVNGRLRGRRGARLTAITNGSAIPDQFDYDVVMLPEELSVGSLNEDFAFESLPGDIFQLGNTSYRILKVDPGKVFVEDAKGQPPNIPFWFGEAPGRSDELSLAVSRLRQQMDEWLDDGLSAAIRRLEQELDLATSAAEQLTEYLATSKAALGVLPTQANIVMERFFDELGDTHLVIHSPFGSRLNRAWGLALRKRFCRKFNFELQAAALEDSIVLSLGPSHSFPLEEVSGYLRSPTVRQVLTQAVLAAPMFPTHWRWVASIALAVRRNRNGRRVPAVFQRNDGEDLMAVVFPDQLACAENIAGEREIPDHPLVQQTLDDCLNGLMDVTGLEALLARIASGEVRVTCRDLASPSPLAQEVITARPFAFLDDAPAEERRTQAIRARHLLNPAEAAALASLSPEAIRQVCEEAWPDARNADELHDALVLSGFITEAESCCTGTDWDSFLQALMNQNRATRLHQIAGSPLWVSAERLAQVRAVLPEARLDPVIDPVPPGPEDADDAMMELLRSRLEALGPATTGELSSPFPHLTDQVALALQKLEIEGFVARGQFLDTGRAEEQWCDRRLLARINRYTIKDLRNQIRPVSPAVYMRFLFDWHDMREPAGEGPEAVRLALQKLQGFAAPAAVWESALLARRVERFLTVDLDQLLGSGQYLWLRPASSTGPNRRSGPVRSTPITLLERAQLDAWRPCVYDEPAAGNELSSAAQRVRTALSEQGAIFLGDLLRHTGLLETQLEQALAELVALGLVSSDNFAGLRALITPAAKRKETGRSRRRGGIRMDAGGRWALLSQSLPPTGREEAWTDDAVEIVACALLDRYGILFRALLQRESRHLPPWRLLTRTLRRLEARGEVRGGRFVNGFSGEQFAWPDAIERLRKVRREDRSDGQHIVISAADPLNLAGIVTPGERVPATTRNRLLYRDGMPIAVYVGQEFRWLAEPDPAMEWSARNMLIRNDGALKPTRPGTVAH